MEIVLQKLQEKAYQKSQTSAVKGTQINTATVSYQCEKCKDKGYTIGKQPALTPSGAERLTPEGQPILEDVFIDCECSIKKRAQRLLKISEITPEFQKKTFSSFTTTDKPAIIAEMKEIAKDYFLAYDRIKDTRQNSIALLGQPGSGKTHLLSALANNLIQKKLQRVLYFPYIEGFNDLRSDFEALQNKLNEMNKVDILFIDDLFKGDYSKWEFKQIMGVINYRYLNNKPIMVSSEKNLDQLCDIDEALGSRIYEMTKNYTKIVEGDRWELNHRLQEE